MRVIVSFTTIPSRIVFCKDVILSILNQTHSFDRLYFNIPKKSNKGIAYRIPDSISSIADPRFILNRCNVDYGPITKLLPTLERETDPETVILCCDDDSIWHPKTLQLFLRKHKAHPEDALSLSGFCLGKFPLYFQGVSNTPIDIEVDWIQGTHGILIKRKMLDTRSLLDYSCFVGKEKLLIANDDHWITYNLNKNGIKRYKIAGNCKKYFLQSDAKRIDAISGNLLSFNTGILKICYILSIYNRNVPLLYADNTWSLPILIVIILILLAIYKSII